MLGSSYITIGIHCNTEYHNSLIIVKRLYLTKHFSECLESDVNLGWTLKSSPHNHNDDNWYARRAYHYTYITLLLCWAQYPYFIVTRSSNGVVAWKELYYLSKICIYRTWGLWLSIVSGHSLSSCAPGSFTKVLRVTYLPHPQEKTCI